MELSAIDTLSIAAEGGVVAVVTPGSLSVPCSSGGSAKSGFEAKTLMFGLTVGGEAAQVTSVVVKGSAPTGVTVSNSSIANSKSVSISTAATASGMAAGISFTVTGTYEGVSYSADCTLALIGSQQGTATPAYGIVFDSYSAIYNAQTTAFSSDFHVRVLKTEGTSSSYMMNYTPEFRINDGTWTSMTKNTSDFSYTINAPTMSSVPNTINFRVMSGGIVLCTAAMPITIKGEKGELGKMCYIAGICKDDTEYTSNAQQTVAVEVQATSGTETQIWYLDASTNKVTVGGRTVYVTPENQGKDGIPIVWKQGLNNNNLIRTKYLFADFAKLGEGVVSGDWLFSAHGKIGSTVINASTPNYSGVAGYMFFDGQSPLGVRSVGTATTFHNTSYSTKGNYFSLKGNRVVRVKCKVNGGTMYLALYSNNTRLYETKITSTSETTYDFICKDLDESSSYNIKAYMSSSVYDGTIYSVEVITFAPNYAVDLLTGDTYQSNAYLKGRIEAASGKIGGFDIGAKNLTNVDYQAGISIKNDGTYPTQTVEIGEKAVDDLTGKKCSMRAESKDSGDYNTALSLNASGATYNYAFHGNGNGVLNGYMQGYKVHVIQVTSASTQLELRRGMIQAISKVNSSLNDPVVYLPKLGEIRRTLGLPSDDLNYTDFCCELILINQSEISGESDSKTVKVRGADAVYGDIRDYSREITNVNALPRLMRAAGADLVQVDLEERYNLHFFITYINKRFIANYIFG